MSAAFAIAAGVVGVAGAATSAGMGMAAASRAAKAQGKASKAMKKRTNKATKTFNQQQAQATETFNRQQEQLRQQVAAIDPNIPIQEFDLGALTKDGIEQANRITANTIQQLNKIDPNSAGAIERAYSTLAQGQNLAAKLMAEGAPLESRQAVLRQLAETGGAGFNIGAAGRGMAVPSGAQANYARALGQQDINFRLMGAELGQSLGNTAFNWRNFSAAFIQSPTQMMQIGLQGRGQDIDVAQANIRNRMNQLGMIGDINAGIYGTQTRMAQNIYGAQTGQAENIYRLQQANTAASAARDATTQQSIQGMTSATSGALLGIGGAYGQLAAAQTPSTMYASLGAAQSAAPYASGFSQVKGMGFVPRATAV